jgi:hypothetical protein
LARTYRPFAETGVHPPQTERPRNRGEDMFHRYSPRIALTASVLIATFGTAMAIGASAASASGTQSQSSIAAVHSSSATPTLTTLTNKIHLAYLANNPSNTLLTVSSTDGIHCSTETNVSS